MNKELFGFLKKQKSEFEEDYFWKDSVVNLDKILKDIRELEIQFDTSVIATTEIHSAKVNVKNLRKKIKKVMKAMKNQDKYFQPYVEKTTREIEKSEKEFEDSMKNIEKLNDEVKKLSKILMDAQKSNDNEIDIGAVELQKELDRLEGETETEIKNQKKLEIELKQFEKKLQNCEILTIQREKITEEMDEISDDYIKFGLQIEKIISKHNSQIINETDLQNNFSRFTWQEMEELTGKLFEKKGYSVKVTQPTNDFGIDVWATKDEMVLGIQVKKWNSDVGFEEVAKTLGSNLGKANKYIIISTSSFFTNQAWEHQKQHSNIIELWDTNRFRKELRVNFLD